MARPKLLTPTAMKLPAFWGFMTALFVGATSLCRGQAVEAEHAPAAKAGAVLSFVRNTDWPQTAFEATDSPFVIGVLGEGGDGMADALTRTVSGQRVRGRPIEVRRVTGPKPLEGGATVSDGDLNELLRQVRSAHVLFICDSARDRVDAVLERLGKTDVLTVSDADAFTERGGMVGLTVRAGQVVVDTNLEKIQSTRLKVDPQLLQAKEAGRASTIKAGMVLNFIRYTDWPGTAFTAADSPIVIGVLGEGEMVDVLRLTVSGQRVRGRAIEVRRLTAPRPPAGKSMSDDDLNELIRQVRSTHVLFVCDSERDRVGTVLQRLGKADVLTVSDMDAFAERGGMLGLTIRRKRVAVDANPERIQATQLKVSSQLLRLAQTVKTRGQ